MAIPAVCFLCTPRPGHHSPQTRRDVLSAKKCSPSYPYSLPSLPPPLRVTQFAGQVAPGSRGAPRRGVVRGRLTHGSYSRTAEGCSFLFFPSLWSCIFLFSPWPASVTQRSKNAAENMGYLCDNFVWVTLSWKTYSVLKPSQWQARRSLSLFFMQMWHGRHGSDSRYTHYQE